MRIDSLNVRIGKKEILHDIHAEFSLGQVTVLLGKNGSGKTTLLKTMGGLLKPSSGTIALDEKPLKEISKEELSRKISYLPQNLPLPALSIRELISYGRYPFTSMGRTFTEEDERFVDSSLERIGFASREKELVCHLSGGERTMAYLGMIFAQNTPYVFLDEPAASLDIPSKEKLIGFLQELKKENKCVVISVHDLLLALRIADRILLLEDGKLVSDGTKEELMEEKKYQEIFSCFLLETKDALGQSHYVVEPLKR